MKNSVGCGSVAFHSIDNKYVVHLQYTFWPLCHSICNSVGPLKLLKKTVANTVAPSFSIKLRSPSFKLALDTWLYTRGVIPPPPRPANHNFLAQSCKSPSGDINMALIEKKKKKKKVNRVATLHTYRCDWMFPVLSWPKKTNSRWRDVS